MSNAHNLALLTPVLFLIAQNYSGPPPAKPDVPYLLHAGNLVSTEIAEAAEAKTAEGSTFTIPGANSPVKTPLGFPIFIFRSAKIQPEKLLVYPLESRDGHRLLVFTRQAEPQVYTLTVTRLKGDQFRLEVNDSLPNGEYSLTPAGSNQAFCFAVY